MKNKVLIKASFLWCLLFLQYLQLKDTLKTDIFGATFTVSQNSPREMSNSTARFPSQTPAAPKSHCHRQEQPLLPLVAYFSRSTPTQEPQAHTRSSRKPLASFGCCRRGVSRRQTQISLRTNQSCSNTFPKLFQHLDATRTPVAIGTPLKSPAPQSGFK